MSEHAEVAVEKPVKLRAPRRFLMDANAFGRDAGAAWVPVDSAFDPIEVAKAWFQHRTMVALHAHASRMDRAVEGLGAKSVRQADKKRGGEQPLHLDDVLHIALTVGTDVLPAWPKDATHLFPPEYRPLLGDWTPGQGLLPTFGGAPPSWADLGLAAVQRLDERMDRRHQRLVTGGGFVQELVRIAAAIWGPSRIWTQQLRQGAALDLLVGVDPGSREAVCAVLVTDWWLEQEEATEHLGAQLRAAALRCAHATEAARRWVVLAAEDRGAEIWRDLVWPRTETDVVQVAEPGGRLRDVEFAVVEERRQGRWTVVAIEIGKLRD